LFLFFFYSIYISLVVFTINCFLVSWPSRSNKTDSFFLSEEPITEKNFIISFSQIVSFLLVFSRGKYYMNMGISILLYLFFSIFLSEEPITEKNFIISFSQIVLFHLVFSRGK